MRQFCPALLLAGILVLAACTGVPEGVTPVRGFELQRYLGTWHEIARLDHSFERGLSRVTASYSLRDDGAVKVINRGWNAEAGKWQEAEGRAVFVGARDEGRLKVSFFGPFYGAYNIIALDPGYRHVMICGPDRSYLWILARTPQLEPVALQRLVAQAKSLGFPTEQLIYAQAGKD